MTNGQSSVGSDGRDVVSPLEPELHRERVTVRRRRARSARSPQSDSRQSAKWVATRSRRRTARAFALCAGVLLLMAIGLYFGLSHQESAAPVEGAVRASAAGVA
jgi:hypothetical protein